MAEGRSPIRIDALARDLRSFDDELGRPARELPGHLSWAHVLDAAPSVRSVYLSVTRHVVWLSVVYAVMVVVALVLMGISSDSDVGLALPVAGLGACLAWVAWNAHRRGSAAQRQWTRQCRRLLTLMDAVHHASASSADYRAAGDTGSIQLLADAASRVVSTLRRPPGVWHPIPGLTPGSGPSSAAAGQMEIAIRVLTGADQESPVAPAEANGARLRELLQGPLAYLVNSDNRRATWLITGAGGRIVGSIRTDTLPRPSWGLLLGRIEPSRRGWNTRSVRVFDEADHLVLVVRPVEGTRRRSARVIDRTGREVGRIDDDQLRSKGELIARKHGGRYRDPDGTVVAEQSSRSAERTLRFHDAAGEFSRLLILGDWARDPQPMSESLPT